MTRLESNHPPKPSPAVRDAALSRIASRHSAALDHNSSLVSDTTELDYSVDAGRLRIDVSGPLDLRCWFRLLGIGQAVDDSISECLIDLSHVDRVFDSGIAALVVLARELTKRGVARIRIHGLHHDNTASLAPYLV